MLLSTLNFIEFTNLNEIPKVAQPLRTNEKPENSFLYERCL